MSSFFFNFGKICGLFWLTRKFKYVFFFHSNDFGGAESVHLDILESLSLPAEEVSIIFTLSKDSESGLKRFQLYGNTFNCSKGETNRLLFFFYLGLFSSKLNKSNPLFVFGSVSYFYYRLVPFLKKKIKKYDLIHALVKENQKGFEHMSEPVDMFFTKRFVTHSGIKHFIINQRKNRGESQSMPIVEIPNAVNFKEYIIAEKPLKERLKCVYVGRNSPEKRIGIIINAAEISKAQDLPILFTFVGDKFEDIQKIAPDNCEFKGLIQDRSELSKIYMESDVILLTSDREGLPMSVLEAMYFGCIPIVTDVGGLPDVVDNDCGYLIPHHSEGIDIQVVNLLKQILNSNDLTIKPINCYHRIRNGFTFEVFKNAYNAQILR